MVLPLRDKVLRGSYCAIVDGNDTLEPGRFEFKFTLWCNDQINGLENVSLICLTILFEGILCIHKRGEGSNAGDKYSYQILRTVLVTWSSECLRLLEKAL